MGSEKKLRAAAPTEGTAALDIEPEVDERGEELSEFGYRKMKMSELGPLLPIGVPEGNPAILQKKFDLKEYFAEQEREINKLRSKKGGPGQHPGKLVSSVMSHMLTEFGGHHDFQTTAEKNRLTMINNAAMSDVLYAYVWFRTQATSKLLEIEVTCPACDHDSMWRTDLTSAEVLVADKPEQLLKTFELNRPVKWNDKVYDVVYLEPPKWSAISSHPIGKQSVGDVKMNLMLSAVRAIGNSKDPKQTPIGMGESISGKLTKMDLEQLVTFVDEAFPGPDFNFLIDCKECGHEWLWLLRWNFDFFFGGASLPRRRKS